MARQHDADAVPQRVAARQHRDPCAAARCDLGESCRRAAAAIRAARPRPAAPSPDGGRRRPGSPRSRPGCAPPGSSPASPSSPMPMTLSHASCGGLAAQRVDRGGGERAAAAPAFERDIGEPAGQTRTSASLASAAPTNPTGKPRISAGRVARPPRAFRAGETARSAHCRSRPPRRRDAAATIRPRRRCGWSSALAASAATAGSRRVQITGFSAGSRSRVMPAATISLSTRIAAPRASARRPAATAPRDQARSSRIATSPAACASRTASGRSAAGKRARSASARTSANERR